MTLTTARGIRDAIVSGQTSAVEICRASLDSHRADQSRAQRLQLRRRRARDRARHADRRAARRRRDAGHWPACRSLKDNLCKGCAHDRIIEDPRYLPSAYSATVVDKLESAGRSSSARPTATSSRWDRRTRTPRTDLRNPWATDRTPGGSSGGSAAAVAAQCVHWHWARIPADRSGSRRRSAAWSGSNPPTGESRDMDCWLRLVV